MPFAFTTLTVCQDTSSVENSARRLLYCWHRLLAAPQRLPTPYERRKIGRTLLKVASGQASPLYVIPRCVRNFHSSLTARIFRRLPSCFSTDVAELFDLQDYGAAAPSPHRLHVCTTSGAIQVGSRNDFSLCSQLSSNKTSNTQSLLE